MGMVIDAVTVLNVAVIPKACSFKLAGSSNQKAIAVWSNHLSGHAFPNAGGIAILQTLPRHVPKFVTSALFLRRHIATRLL
jgi:hypothetical protein